MSLEDVAKLLQGVAQTLKTDPRNEYEASVRYNNNTERLTEASRRLEGFSGTYPDALRAELAALEAQVQASRTLTATKPMDAFAIEFSGDDENTNEVAAAEQQLREEEMKRKAKKGAKKGSKKSAQKLQEQEDKDKAERGEAGESLDHGVHPWPSPQPPAQDMADEVAAVWLPGESMQELTRHTACSFRDIPVEALGKAECRLIPHTPQAAIIFHTEIDLDGDACRCVVEVPRFMVLALAKSALRDGAAVDMPVTTTNSGAGADASDEDDTLEDNDDEARADGQPSIEMGDRSNLSALSERLVDGFDAAKEEEEASERQLAAFPRELSAAATAPMRGVTEAVWVVLMCHGGYFSGGVFKNSQCVVHKSFQRYVVRKKQGGRQATADGGGSFNSIGSQIRAAQEVKYRLDVRSLLYAWRRYIDAASLILYVAPGPLNRSMLADFSSLPPSTAIGETGPSPVSLKDPRVHKAPLTSHRPSFEEVQRIFATVSRCNVVYGKELK